MNTYQFVAENTGKLTLYAVMIADPLPGLTALGGTLPPGATITCPAAYAAGRVCPLTRVRRVHCQVGLFTDFERGFPGFLLDFGLIHLQELPVLQP